MSDLLYVVSLARRETDTIGFLPASRYDALHAAGRLLLQRENGEPCGFLAFGPIDRQGTVHVYQACVQTDARRLGSATAMVRRLESWARIHGARRISLRCAVDLPANEFWRAYGFQCCGASQGGRRRGRLILHYRLDLSGAGSLLF